MGTSKPVAPVVISPHPNTALKAEQKKRIVLNKENAIATRMSCENKCIMEKMDVNASPVALPIPTPKQKDRNPWLCSICSFIINPFHIVVESRFTVLMVIAFAFLVSQISVLHRIQMNPSYSL